VSGHRSEQATKVAGIFGYLADRDFRGYSPLYEHLARHVATDEAIPMLISGASSRNHAPILFFACIHDLVLQAPDSALARAYAAVAAGADPDEVEVWPQLQALVADRAEEIDHLLRTRQVQTNEVGRSGPLVPALTLVGQRFDRPLGLVEIGCSAGLNLLADRFRITYTAGDGKVEVGPETSPVRLSCDVHGTRRPPLPDPDDDLAPPAVIIGSRLGLDRAPVDVTDPAAVRWLQACLWPDLGERRQRLDAAVALAAADPPELWAGDALNLVDAAIESVDAGFTPCVVSTWVLAYISHAQRLELHDRLTRLARHRPMAWVTAEYEDNVPWLDPPGRRPALDAGQLPTRLGIEIWDRDTTTITSLAWMHAHGQWLEWIDDPGRG
jgi:hypothetical protein